jgi:hypothetical protein
MLNKEVKYIDITNMPELLLLAGVQLKVGGKVSSRKLPSVRWPLEF